MTDNKLARMVAERVQEMLTGADHLPADREPEVFESPEEGRQFVLDGVYRRQPDSVGQLVEEAVMGQFYDRESDGLTGSLLEQWDIDLAKLALELLQLEAVARLNEVMAIRTRSTRQERNQ